MGIFKTSAEREAELEAKIKEIEDDAAGKAADPVNIPDTNLSPEEKTFKKRYSDLRSHAARLENDLRKEINDLKDQLTASTKKSIDFPKSTEEVQAWADKYPEIYDTIVTIARQNAIDVQKDVQQTVQAIQEREYEVEKRSAKQSLYSAHPDFPEIATTQDFIDWIEVQPKYIYDALYVNETDAASAVRAVDLYKADRGITNQKRDEKKTPDTRDAAQRIPSGHSTTNVGSGVLKWTESKLQGINWNRLTEKELQEIDEAQNDPAFYDVSGAAR